MSELERAWAAAKVALRYANTTQKPWVVARGGREIVPFNPSIHHSGGVIIHPTLVLRVSEGRVR